jgi:16S rRNA (guanine527-N7)-methyltransferase
MVGVSRETDQLNVSCETLKFIEILTEWNKTINLTSAEGLDRHVNDSIQLNNYIDRADRVADVGSGNGMPGIILSIYGKSVHLLEIDKRKCAFLRAVISSLNLTAKVYEGDCRELKEPHDVVVCKAFGSVKKIIDTCKHLGNKLLLIKGKDHMREIQEALQERTFSVEIHPISGETNGVILEIWNVKNDQ